jgi:hypothetical protein
MKMQILIVTTLGLMVGMAAPASAQLDLAWMIPAAAHVGGEAGTFWFTDVSLHNPHEFDLPIIVQALESETVNNQVPTIPITLYPWETLNLWDAFGEDIFDIVGTGAILAYIDLDSGINCDPAESCHFLVTSRTYTPGPLGVGEYGQTIPGRTLAQGIDWWTYGYTAGIMNDGNEFRTNIGVASWTGEWLTVKADVQDRDGQIIGTQTFTVPPFSHVQRRLAFQVSGGAVVFYLDGDGPEDALVYTYASVVNQETGDASFQPSQWSEVGVSFTKQGMEKPAGPRQPQYPGVKGEPLQLRDRDRERQHVR